MKKILYLVAAIFIAFASCSKTDTLYELNTPSQHNEVSFSSGVGTKAIVENSTYDEAFEFYVFGRGGYYVGGANGSLVGDSVAYDANYNVWRTINNTYFWKFADSNTNTSEPMDFFAIHPADAPFVSTGTYAYDNTVGASNDQKVTMTNATPGTVVGSQTDLMTSYVDNITATRTNTSHPNLVDVDNTSLYPAHGSESEAHGTATDKTVNFKFRHEFAQIKFQARTATKSNIVIKIKKLEFIVPYISGTVESKGFPTNDTYKSTWTQLSGEHNYAVIDEANGVDAVKYAVKVTNASNSQTPNWVDLSYHYTKYDSTNDTETATTDNHNILVIPQNLSQLTDGTMIKVTYDVHNTMSVDGWTDFEDVEREISISQVIAGDYPDEWKAGYIYTYRLDVNLYEILFSATVEEWTSTSPVDANEPNVYEFY